MKKNILRLLIVTLAIPSVCLAKDLNTYEKAQCATGKGLEVRVNYDFGPGTSSNGYMEAKYLLEGNKQFPYLENSNGKSFTGWYSDSAKKNKVFAVWQLPIKIVKDSNGCASSITPVTIYADYQTITNSCIAVVGSSVQVTYNFGDGRANQTVTWYSSNPNANTILTPTRDGYLFDGWYLDQNFNYSYKDIGVPLYQNINNCHTGEPYYAPVTLYAKWKTPMQTYEDILDDLLFNDVKKAKEEAAQYNGKYHKVTVVGNILTLTLIDKKADNSIVELTIPYSFANNQFEYNDDSSKSAYERVQASMANIMLLYAGLVEGGMGEEDAMKAMFTYDFSKATMARNGVAITYGDVVDYSDGGNVTQVKLIDNLKMSSNGVYVDGLPKSELGSLIGDPSLFENLPITPTGGSTGGYTGETDYGTTENPKTGVYDYVIYLIIAMPVGYTLIRLINRHRKFQHLN